MFTELAESLEGLLNIRLQNGRWDDSENKPGLLRTLEALTCFGALAYYYETLKIFEGGFKIIEIPKEVLIDDLSSVLGIVEKEGFPPSPYLDEDFDKRGIKYEKGKTDFTYTVSLFLTSMLDLMEYFGIVYEEQIPKYEIVKQRMVESLNWLINNAIKKDEYVYWSWGIKDATEDIPSVYFTWSAVIALSYAYQSEYTPISNNEKKQIQELLNGVSRWITSIIEEDPNFPGKRWRINYPRFEDSESGRRETLLIYAMNTIDWLDQAEILVNPQTVEKIFSTLLDIWKTDETFRFESGDHLLILPPEITGLKKGIMLKYEDPAWEYLLLSALCWCYMAYQENKFKIKEKDFKDLEKFIEEQRKKLLDDRDPKTKLWKRDSFLIYLTLGAIEAIVNYLCYVYPYIYKGYKGEAISLQDAIRLAVEFAFEEYKSELAEKIYKNIMILRKGQKEE